MRIRAINAPEPGTPRDAFVTFHTKRGAQLAMPMFVTPSLQTNMNGVKWPAADAEKNV
ncbi:MAG: hypothetical protein ABJM43_21005 [Paracoccaceae bacterium]